MQASLPSSQDYAARKRLQPWLVNGAMILIVALLMLPIALTLSTSFKREQDVLRKPPVLFPCDGPDGRFRLSECRFDVEGYERVIAPRPDPNSPLGFSLTGRMFSTYVPNTLLYALVSSALVFVLSGFAGYAFSRYRFRGRRALMVAILAITGIPLLTNLLALYQMAVDLRKAGIPGYDERMFIIAVYVGFQLPFSVWIVKGFFDTIPRELEEAAFIDGCTPIGALWRIVVPLAMPGLLAAFLLCFVNVWNEFIAGYLLITKRDLRTVMFGMYDFLSQNIINYQVVAAACVLIAAPVVILFLFTRKTFFQAMTEGAVKG
ncbi:MAG: carbohydrate ABC transporter permease [Candidatus Brachytrichaceae bacterium NZ_4S206]|jgi:multiple sugar transport system permease protein